jgi:3-hydroxyisobutyrate dehydrogenase-like beta-hydroxyacid dehydrogenase
MKIAFAGLGNMGEPIARNLLKAGNELTVYNRTRARAEPLGKEGAKIADKPAGLMPADAVFTMLADDGAVEGVVFGPGGLIETMPKGAIHLSLSTISVALSKRLAAAHAAKGQGYVAAPVFGRPEAAAAQKLFVVAAGAPAEHERVKPLLEAISQRIFTIGADPSVANVVKLSGNFLIASVLESLGEAMALVRKYGVDPHAYIEILTNTLFAAPVYKTYGAIIADEKYKPAGFALPLGLKDVKLALAAAEAMGAPMPLASMLRDHALTAIARGYGEHDWSVLAKLAAENAGLNGKTKVG